MSDKPNYVKRVLLLIRFRRRLGEMFILFFFTHKVKVPVPDLELNYGQVRGEGLQKKPILKCMKHTANVIVIFVISKGG